MLGSRQLAVFVEPAGGQRCVLNEQLSFRVCEQQSPDNTDDDDDDGLPPTVVNKPRVSLFIDLPNDFSPLLP